MQTYVQTDVRFNLKEQGSSLSDFTCYERILV